MKICMGTAKWFLDAQIRTISDYWKDLLEYVLCPRIFLTTHVFSFWIFRSFPVSNMSTEPLQMKYNMSIHMKS